MSNLDPETEEQIKIKKMLTTHLEVYTYLCKACANSLVGITGDVTAAIVLCKNNLTDEKSSLLCIVKTIDNTQYLLPVAMFFPLDENPMELFTPVMKEDMMDKNWDKKSWEERVWGKDSQEKEEK